MCSWSGPVHSWMGALKDEHRVAAGTLVKYLAALERYSVTLAHLSPEAVRERDVRVHIRTLSAFSPATVRVHLSAIKSFHQWLAVENECIDPTVRLRAPKRPERLPRYVNDHEVRQMLATCEGPDWMAIRDRALIETMYSTGCRSTELREARLEDVDLDRCVLTVIGKGNRQRMAVLSPAAVLALQSWLMARTRVAERGNRHLFVANTGRGMSAMGLWKIVKARAEAAGLRQHVHPHMFRHACATSLLRGGADLRSIQLLLGHRNISSTQHYLHLDDVTLRKVHAAAHPRGGDVDARLRTVGSGGPMDGGDGDS
jgi:site-specific recombinase XerD